MLWCLSITQHLSKTGVPVLQERWEGALLEGRDNGSWPGQLPCAAVRQWDSRVGRLLQLLQDHMQGFFKELRHQPCVNGCAEDRTGTQHAEDVSGEAGPITWGGKLSGRRVVLDGNHRCLALVTMQEIDQFHDPPLGYAYAMHGEEQG